MKSFPSNFTYKYAKECYDKKKEEEEQEKLLSEARMKFVKSVESGIGLSCVQLKGLTSNSKSKLLKEISGIFKNIKLQKLDNVISYKEINDLNFSEIGAIYVEL